MESPAKDTACLELNELTSDEQRLAEFGHVQELDRQFSLVSIAALGLVSTNSWAAVSSVLALGIYSGGLPALIWGFIVVTIPNFFIGLSLSELASSYPVAGGVYMWASAIASEKHAGPASYITAYLNIAAWILGVASISATLGQEFLAIANMINPNITVDHWKIFVCYQAWNFATALGATLFNRGLPALNRAALFYVICALLVIAVTCVAKAPSHLPAKAVFVDWDNETGYASAGLAFLTGLVNVNYGYTSLDTVVHLSEELPRASINVPRAIMATVICGFCTCLPFLICIFFSIQDIGGVLTTSTSFPLAEIFRQAAGQKGGVALMIIFTIANITALPNTQISTSRLVWAAARDGAVPFSSFFAKVSPRYRVPVNAQVLVWFLSTCLGCIYIGYPYAFNSLIGSSLIVNYLSWGVPILINVLRGRKYFVRGYYSMGPILGYTSNIISLLWIVMVSVLWCFPYGLPVILSETMNWSSVVIGGFLCIAAVFWIAQGRRTYRPPRISSPGSFLSTLYKTASL